MEPTRLKRAPSCPVAFQPTLARAAAPDFANAAGIEPIITTSSTTSVEKFAELVEYCWGNSSTPLGAKRNADGHPAPYRIRFFELGNVRATSTSYSN